MNKNIALLAAVSAIALATSANALEFRPYVGAQYNLTSASVKDMPNMDMHSYSVFVGTDYNRYFGTEVFYQNSNKWHKVINGEKTKVDFEAYGLDVYGYLPLGCDRVFSLLGTAGIANYDFDIADNNAKGEENGLGYRLGAGMQYNITNNIAVRGIVRYIWADKLDNTDHMMEYSLGAKYSF
ncbi:MAG: porin family protein [Alphaproteobacteria bacterium]|nr:porin family protein [Alphaproteobacteria bacterium]